METLLHVFLLHIQAFALRCLWKVEGMAAVICIHLISFFIECPEERLFVGVSMSRWK